MIAAGLVLVAALCFFFAGVAVRVSCCPSRRGGVCDDACPQAGRETDPLRPVQA